MRFNPSILTGCTTAKTSVDNRLQMQRIVVVGSTGSGKSTLAQQLSERLHIPHIELDSLNWEENWHPSPDNVFRKRVDLATGVNCWIVDGNYSKVRDLVWSRADTLIWLDYNFIVIFWRLLWRSIHRVFSRELLWGKNRETWRQVFFSRDSLFVWLVKTYSRRRKEYPELFSRRE
jgi:adenylate kinase family enzyme